MRKLSVGTILLMDLVFIWPAFGTSDVLQQDDGAGGLEDSYAKQSGTAGISVSTTGSGTDSTIRVGDRATGDRTSYVDLIGDSTYTTYGLRLHRGGGGANTYSRLLHRGSGALELWALDENGYIRFLTEQVERMRINEEGNVGIGTASPDYALDVSGTGYFSGALTLGGALKISNTGVQDAGGQLRIDVTDNGALVLYDDDGTTQKLSISTDGVVTIEDTLYVEGVAGTPRTGAIIHGHVGLGENSGPPSYDTDYELRVFGAAKNNTGTWNTTSDARLKKNIQPITGALEKITQLRGVEYEWINPGEHGEGIQIGFLAQEVEAIFPDWVGGSYPLESSDDYALIPEGEKAKDIGIRPGFQALTVEAFRELREENELLKNEVDALKAMLCEEHPRNFYCATMFQ